LYIEYLGQEKTPFSKEKTYLGQEICLFPCTNSIWDR